MTQITCYACQKNLEFDDKPGFRAECPSCSADLHVCRNCKFYDASVYNECRESSADRVREKERANFCEYFLPASRAQNSAPEDPTAIAKRKLEEMFRKK